MGVKPNSPMLSPPHKYLSIRALGAPALLLSLAMQGVFRGFKDTKTPLFATVVADVIYQHRSRPHLHFCASSRDQRYFMTLILFICLAKKVNLIPPNFGDLQFEGSLKMVHADGVLFHANSLKIDEQEITSPHDIVQKDLQIDPFVLSGSKLIEGICTMLRLINNNKTVKKILDRKVQKSDY